MFKGMPDIFEYRDIEESDRRADYIHDANLCATYHLGATLADTLSMFIRPYYLNNEKK